MSGYNSRGERLRSCHVVIDKSQLGTSPKQAHQTLLRATKQAGDESSTTPEPPPAIALLQERRSALISAAVTGQIDVRGFSTGGSEAA